MSKKEDGQTVMQVKMSADLHRKMKIIAINRGITLNKCCTDSMEAFVEQNADLLHVLQAQN